MLVAIGGQGKPKDIYPLVAKKLSQIRDEDLAETLPSGPNKWTNRVQWVRQRLIYIPFALASLRLVKVPGGA